jgi:hypothetical protein
VAATVDVVLGTASITHLTRVVGRDRVEPVLTEAVVRLLGPS